MLLSVTWPNVILPNDAASTMNGAKTTQKRRKNDAKTQKRRKNDVKTTQKQRINDVKTTQKVTQKRRLP